MLKFSNTDRTVALQTHGNFLYKSYLITSNSRKSPNTLLHQLLQFRRNPLFPNIYWWNHFPLVKWCNLIIPTSPNDAVLRCEINSNFGVTSSFFATKPESNSVIVSQRCNFIFPLYLSWEHSRHSLCFRLGVHALVLKPRTGRTALSYTGGLWSHSSLRPFSFSLGSISVDSNDLMAINTGCGSAKVVFWKKFKNWSVLSCAGFVLLKNMQWPHLSSL